LTLAGYRDKPIALRIGEMTRARTVYVLLLSVGLSIDYDFIRHGEA